MAEGLIEQWALVGTIEEWQSRAVEMMSKPENMRAVKRLADELLEVETLDWDDIGILTDIADGISTEADYLQFKALRAHVLPTEDK